MIFEIGISRDWECHDSRTDCLLIDSETVEDSVAINSSRLAKMKDYYDQTMCKIGLKLAQPSTRKKISRHG